MHWKYIGLAALLLAAGAEAQTSPSIQHDGTTVQATATGISIDPADQATITLNLRKTGATNAEARANVRAFAEQLTAELTQLGVPKQGIDFEEAINRMGFVGNENLMAAMQGGSENAASTKRPISATASLELRISDLSLLPKLRQFADSKDAVIMENPAFSLTDDRRVRQAAIADGIKKARSDADAFAAALGMKVVRVISAGDQAAEANFLFPEYGSMLVAMTGRTDVKSGMVKTSVPVILRVGVEPR